MKLLTLSLVLFSLTAGRAWDPAGHMLIGQIAWEHTTPTAREKAGELLSGLETTFNGERPYTFITAGCWMDDMRSKRGYAWSKWHYVTLPWTADGAAFEIPPPPHVVWAIDENVKTLRDAEATPDAHRLALAMLMHFLGDVHQPMHATDRGDRGGNGVLIRGVSFSDLWPGTVPNLHAFWDKAFRFDDGGEGKVAEMWPGLKVPDRPAAPGEGVIAAEAAKIMTQFPRASVEELIAQGSATEWARESHALGCRSGYPEGVEPSDHQVATLAPEFAHRSREIATRRIALAGYRLAALLNDLLK